MNEKQVTTPKVQEEILSNCMIQMRFQTAVDGGRLTVRDPSEGSMRSIEASAMSVGDTFFLSETDKQVLALALEIKASGCDPRIITDDYSIQNVATKLGIEFDSLATFGIRRLLEWMRYCPACHREYPADYPSTQCTVCGTKLKRKPRKKLRTLKQ